MFFKILDEQTMCLLTYSFYMLAEHPDIEDRLRKEIYEKVGETERPTYDQMREMKYMRAFLNGNVYSVFCVCIDPKKKNLVIEDDLFFL